MLGEVGEVRVGGQQSAGRPRKKWSDCVIARRYELVGSGGACDTGSIDVEGSHRPSNPIIDRQMWMLNYYCYYCYYYYYYYYY